MNKLIKGLQKQLTKSMRQSVSEDKVEEVIKRYFDNRDWKYQMFTDENSIITFRLGITGDNETIHIKIDVDPENNKYHIIGGTDTIISANDVCKGILAMNEYNLRAMVVSGCIANDGSIIFWLGRNLNGNAFSEESFVIDFYMVVREADYQTAQIFKQASLDNNKLEI